MRRKKGGPGTAREGYGRPLKLEYEQDNSINKPARLPLSLACCSSKQTETVRKASQQIVPAPGTDMQGPRAP